MGYDSQGVREWIDFMIAIGAWAVSIFVVFMLFKVFVFPYITV